MDMPVTTEMHEQIKSYTGIFVRAHSVNCHMAAWQWHPFTLENDGIHLLSRPFGSSAYRL